MEPKSLWIDPDLPPELLAAVDRAQPVLERELGEGVGRAEVSWAAVRPVSPVGPAVRLTLCDSGVTRSEVYFLSDFADGLHLRRSFREVWGEVLNERSRNLRRGLHEMLAREGWE